MSLINKERLLEDLRERSPLDWDDEGEEYGLLVSKIIIGEQPTVDAIPVKWITGWLNMGYWFQGENLVHTDGRIWDARNVEVNFKECIEIMIRDWEESEYEE